MHLLHSLSDAIVEWEEKEADVDAFVFYSPFIIICPIDTMKERYWKAQCNKAAYNHEMNSLSRSKDGNANQTTTRRFRKGRIKIDVEDIEPTNLQSL